MKKKRARKKLTPEEKNAKLKKRQEIEFRRRILSGYNDAELRYL